MPRFLPLLTFAFLLLASSAQAGDGGDSCTAQFPAAESRWAIPAGLLSAIAQVESNRWPWTIDAAGQSHSFPSRIEAELAAQTLRAQGLRNIDLGCMQISMLHHPDAFSSLSQAFDPAANVEYAARFLAGLHRLSGSWEAAVSRYHSATPALGEPYLRRVMAIWRGGGSPLIGAIQGSFSVETSFGVRVWRPTSHPTSPGGHLIIINQRAFHTHSKQDHG